ncbi:hypothetical protein [Novosphingobium sp.]|uniref:hypothetical protein n=1 Tax=Novosphingobium sp. TaxID=1874826 RepID=UPI003BAC14F7
MIFFTSYAPECCLPRNVPVLELVNAVSSEPRCSGASIGKCPKQTWLTKRLPVETIRKDFHAPTRNVVVFRRIYLSENEDIFCSRLCSAKAIQAVTRLRAAW